MHENQLKVSESQQRSNYYNYFQHTDGLSALASNAEPNSLKVYLPYRFMNSETKKTSEFEILTKNQNNSIQITGTQNFTGSYMWFILSN